MKTIDYIEDKIPAYALSYLVNGDDSGIDTEDKEACDEWLQSLTTKLRTDYPGCDVQLVTSDEHPDFCHRPAFGLACDCVDGALFVMVADTHPAESIEPPSWATVVINP